MSAKGCHRERSVSSFSRSTSNIRNKRNQARYYQLLRADSDEVDFDSLLKVVNELSNMINDDGELNDGRNSKRNSAKLNKKCPSEIRKNMIFRETRRYYFFKSQKKLIYSLTKNHTHNINQGSTFKK